MPNYTPTADDYRLAAEFAYQLPVEHGPTWGQASHPDWPYGASISHMLSGKEGPAHKFTPLSACTIGYVCLATRRPPEDVDFAVTRHFWNVLGFSPHTFAAKPETTQTNMANAFITIANELEKLNGQH